MDPRDLEAFSQFLRLSDQARKKPSFFETFQAKAAISVGLFAAAVAAFEHFGIVLEWMNEWIEERRGEGVVIESFWEWPVCINEGYGANYNESWK